MNINDFWKKVAEEQQKQAFGREIAPIKNTKAKDTKSSVTNPRTTIKIEQKKKRKKKEEDPYSSIGSTDDFWAKVEEYQQEDEEQDEVGPVLPSTLRTPATRQFTQAGGSTLVDWNDYKTRTPDSTWFKESDAFKDGYDFGDVTKTILNTGEDLLVNLGAGVVGLGEKAVDAFATMAPYIMQSQMATSPLWDEKLRKKQDDLVMESRKQAEEFVAGDLYDEKAVAEWVLGVNPGYTDNSVLGEKSQSLAQSGGQLLGTIGLQAVGVPWYATTGVSTFGGESENALNQGASLTEAMTSGFISAGAEMLTEKLFGGSGLGEQGLIDTDLLTRGITNKLVKTLADYGVDIASEGAEEVFSEIIGNFGSALYKEENLAEILMSEEAIDGYIDSFIGGSVLGGTMNASKFVSSAKSGTDYRSDNTQVEQKVIDKLFQDALAEESKNGKVSAKRKAEINNDIQNKLDKGYISTDTIEEVLAGDQYKALKKAEADQAALRKKYQEAQAEYDKLYEMPNSEKSNKQIDREAELKKLLPEMKRQLDSTWVKRLRTNLDSNIQSMIAKDNKGKGNRLAESYIEVERGKQLFNADPNKYSDPYARKSIQNLMDSKSVNNTNRSKEFAETIAKLASDQKLTFTATDAKKLAQTSLGIVRTADLTADGNTTEFDIGVKDIATEFKPVVKVDGKVVDNYQVDFKNGKITFDSAPQGAVSVEYRKIARTNGWINTKTGEVTINVSSPRAWQVTVGHEVTHALEGTKFHDALKTSLKNFLGKEWDSRLAETKANYAGMDADPEAELVSDLVGEYLFTDSKFIQRLSTEDRNLFQKIWDEIKYLSRIVTAGSKEARQLEQVKKAFEEAYRAGGKTNVKAEAKTDGKVQHSLTPEQQKGYDYNQKQTTTGSTLKTLKGSPIKRSSKYGVGKEIGGEIYFHKQYAEEIVPDEVLSQAERLLAEHNPDFEYNCLKYNPKTGVVAFQEAPDFDTAREPVVGDYVSVNVNTGAVKEGHSNYIWHHKWNWVKNDYQGFNVAESWNWSKRWLSTLTEVSDGNGIQRWNNQLDKYGLPHDGEVQYSLSPVEQGATSADTSIKQIPALFKNKNVQFGETNIDIGGGRFDLAKDYLAERGTKSMIFDPYNRSAEENKATLEFLQSGNKADTATCANVLNVIDSPAARSNVILEAAKAIKPEGTAYFMVYEGNGTGIGKPTSKGWQSNRKTADYLDEIRQWFDNVTPKGKLIIAKNPKANLPEAAWEIQPGEAVKYSLGYHAGDLGKAESLAQQGLGRSTGHFGTGTYFVGNKKAIEGYNTRGGKPAPVETVDFDKYNLFTPKTANDGLALHKFLHGMDGFWDRSSDAVNTMAEYENLQGKLNDLVYEIESEDFGEADPNTESWLAAEQEFVATAKRMMGEYIVGDTLTKTLRNLTLENYQYYNGEYYTYDPSTDQFTNYDEADILKRLNAEAGGWRAFEDIEREADRYHNYSDVVEHERWEKSIGKIADMLGVSDSEIRRIIRYVTEDIQSQGYSSMSNARNDAYTADSAATRFMKALGYEGIDVRGIKELDNVTYGSVIYDLKGEDLARKNEIGTAKYSLSDSNGRQLTSEQAEYFQDSKVRDENGNLKIMYHGTSKGGHTVFDTYGSNYGLFGQGSYFTDSKDVAEKYTYKGTGNNRQVYETYLNITNPMDMDAPANPEEWAKAFPEASFPEYGTNEDFYRAMEEYFYDEMYHKWEAAEEAMEAIRGMGYDGITHIGGGRVNPNGAKHQVYIAFDPEQIKNVDNAKPTSDPDIRYSIEELENAYQYDIEKGDMIGAELAVERAANLAMPNSKIRGKDGKLIPVYHGTKADFWEFDTSADGGKNGTAEGFGIYLSDDTEVTEVYGDRQLKMYANITKPATSNKKTITAGTLAKLIEDTCKRQAQQMVADGEYDSIKEALFDTWVSNYAMTYDIGMKAAYREVANSIRRMESGDMGIIQEVMTGMGIRDYDSAMEFYRNSLVPITGFDGFATQWTHGSTGKKQNIYLAFDSSQLKVADAVTYDNSGNVIPLSERFNPEKKDIRYSLTEQETQETNQKLSDVGLQYDGQSGTVSYSVSSLKDMFHAQTDENGIMLAPDDYIVARDEYVTALARSIAEDKDHITAEEMAKADRYLNSLFLIGDMIERDSDRLDYEAAVGKSAWVSNAEYGGSIDFSTLCAKRRLFTGTFDAIQNALPDTVLTDKDFLQIRNLLLAKELESPCSMCYVEGSRAKHGEYVAKWLQEYLKTNPEWKPQIADFTSTTGLERTRINHREAYEAYQEAMNKLAQRKPKEASVRTDYKGEILVAFADGTSVEIKNLNGGIRFNSFSDFEVIHALDCMQVMTDMARVGLAGQGYTKVKEFAEAFGDTGLKINLSLVAKDVDKNGKLIYDEVNGMKYADAKNLRGRYSDNVGTVIVVFTDAQMRAAIADPEIDYVLPFHRSQWKKSQYAMMGLPVKTKDYTMVQNDRIRNPATGRAVKLEKLKHTSYFTTKTGEIIPITGNIMPNQYWDYNADGRTNAQTYLDYINANKMIPKFQFLLNKVDGKWVLPEGAVGDGYFKLLIDFKMYNNEGVGAPQKPVLPEFNMPFIQQMLENYKGGHQSFPVAHDVVDEFVAGKKSGKYSLSMDGEAPVRRGDFYTPANELLYSPDIAPVAEATAENSSVAPVKNTPVAEMFPNDIAPLHELDSLNQEKEALENRMLEMAYAEDFSEMDKVNARYMEVQERISELEDEISRTDNARFNSLSDADVPPEMAAPYPGEPSPIPNPLADRNIADVGNRKVKAYMYENPEVKPFFQDEARGMLWDLHNGTRGERIYNEDLHYQTGGEKGWMGTKRHTTADIAELLDTWRYSYDQIEKGLNAIIEDNGAENNAVSKRIEFMLHDRLAYGYTDVWGEPMPANQDYIRLLRERQIEEYSAEARENFFANADMYAPPADIGPVAPAFETVNTDSMNGVVNGQQTYYSTEDKLRRANSQPVTEMDAPLFEAHTSKDGQVKGQQTLLRDSLQNESDRVAKVLTAEPASASKKGRWWSWLKNNVFDRGMVFEDLSLEKGNRELQAKWNSTRYAEGMAQNLMTKGANGVKPLQATMEAVEKAGKSEDFFNYMYHAHNVDRMSLEERFGVENKSVFGDTVTAEVSRETAKQLSQANPEFKTWAKEVYSFMGHLRKLMVDNGIISRETAALWARMYPHFVPIGRVDKTGLNINVPLATNRTGVNAPVKKAVGGSSDIRPLFNVIGERTIQTYKAIARNRFGVELKNTLGTTIAQDAAKLDETIDSIDNQDGLLKKGEKGKNPTFTVFENGKRVTFEITEEMYDALKPAEGILNETAKPLNIASNIFRGLVTEYNPTFMVTNPIKDFQDVLINSQHPMKTYMAIPKALGQMASNGHYYEEYLNNGGDQNTYFDNDEKTFKVEKVPKWLEVIGNANSAIERLPRLAEYIASREAGASIDVAMLDAARVTTNFAAGGAVTKFLNRNGATFLNASMQGAVQQVRNFREAKVNGVKGWINLATKALAAGLPAMMLNHLLWDDDDEYADLSDYVKQNYYIIGKYDDGKFIRIPKGRTVAVIQNAFEQMENLITGNDEVDLGTFLELAISNLAPNNPLENNIIAPLAQVANNTTWYGDDLIPTRLQNLPAAEQYDETTDEFSKWLGGLLNYSPYKINYLLDQYGGGLADMVLPTMTPAAENGDSSIMGTITAPFRDKFTTDSVLKNQNVTDFYDLKDELTINANSMYATDEDTLKSMYMNAVNSEISQLYRQKREIQNSNLSEEEKYAQVRDVQRQIVDLMKEGMGSYENISYEDDYRAGGTYARIGDRVYKQGDDGSWSRLSGDQLTKYEVTKAAGDAVYASDGENHYKWYEPGEDSTEAPYWKKITEDELENQEEVTSALGITPEEYWEKKEEYTFAYKSPGDYAIANIVGGYDDYIGYKDVWSKFDAKDKNGNSVSGLKKQRTKDYIYSLDLPEIEKHILFKSQYKTEDEHNMEIIDYLNDRDDVSYEQMVAILKELGFEVSSDGTITWD